MENSGNSLSSQFQKLTLNPKNNSDSSGDDDGKSPDFGTKDDT